MEYQVGSTSVLEFLPSFSRSCSLQVFSWEASDSRRHIFCPFELKEISVFSDISVLCGVDAGGWALSLPPSFTPRAMRRWRFACNLTLEMSNVVEQLSLFGEGWSGCASLFKFTVYLTWVGLFFSCCLIMNRYLHCGKRSSEAIWQFSFCSLIHCLRVFVFLDLALLARDCENAICLVFSDFFGLAGLPFSLFASINSWIWGGIDPGSQIVFRENSTSVLSCWNPGFCFLVLNLVSFSWLRVPCPALLYIRETNGFFAFDFTRSVGTVLSTPAVFTLAWWFRIWG